MPVQPRDTGAGADIVTLGNAEYRSWFDAFGTASVAISVKATPGYLCSVYVTNKNAALRYLHLYDKTSAPVGSDVPVCSLPIPAGSATVPGVLSLTDAFFSQGGRRFTAGIAVGVSTAEGSHTAATASDHDISGSYI